MSKTQENSGQIWKRPMGGTEIWEVVRQVRNSYSSKQFHRLAHVLGSSAQRVSSHYVRAGLIMRRKSAPALRMADRRTSRTFYETVTAVLATNVHVHTRGEPWCSLVTPGCLNGIGDNSLVPKITSTYRGDVHHSAQLVCACTCAITEIRLVHEII